MVNQAEDVVHRLIEVGEGAADKQDQGERRAGPLDLAKAEDQETDRDRPDRDIGVDVGVRKGRVRGGWEVKGIHRD